MLVLTAANTALLLLIWITLVVRSDREKKRKGAMTGIFCGHCRQSLPSDPIKAIAVESMTYLVYKCRCCQNETLLPLK